jgi:hypothetical protein
MNKDRMKRPTVWGELARDSEAHVHLSTKHTGGKTGGCASKAVELTSETRRMSRHRD